MPKVFENQFEIVHHHYPIRHSKNTFTDPTISLKATKFAISSRGPHLWNSLIDKDAKTITPTPIFKKNTI